MRTAQLENTQLTLEALTEFYREKDASKAAEEIAAVHSKCVGMTKKAGECVGAAANQLARRLKKKYGSAPKQQKRFDGSSSSSDKTTEGNKKSSDRSSRSGGAGKNNEKGAANLHLASLQDLQAELERRLDEQREAQVDAEDPDEDEPDPDYHRWEGPDSMFPERLVIVGGGPAGMAAALYGARAGLRPLVIAPSMGGQLQGKGVEVENYPGLFNQTGPSVIAAMRAQAAHFGAVFEDDVVYAVTVDRDPATAYRGESPEPIQIHTNATGTIDTHTLIVATGAEANWLGVKGEWELRGGGVSSCAVCDGFLYANQHVAIVGGGDAAMEDALVLARTSSKVTVVHRRDRFRASKVLADRVLEHPRIVVRWNATVQEILGRDLVVDDDNDEGGGDDGEVDMDNTEKVVEGVVLRDVATGETEKLACDAVFVAIGHTPATSFLQNVVEFDPVHKGYIHVGKGTTATSVSGIFAAGDVSDAVYRQAITSAGSGAAAALDAERYLSEHGLGNEAAELEAELMADLMSEDALSSASSSYNAYEEAGGRMEGMKESLAAAAGEL